MTGWSADLRVEQEWEVEARASEAESTFGGEAPGTEGFCDLERRAGSTSDAPVARASATRSTLPVRSTRGAHSNRVLQRRAPRHARSARLRDGWSRFVRRRLEGVAGLSSGREPVACTPQGGSDRVAEQSELRERVR